jgi:hypothetical protein
MIDIDKIEAAATAVNKPNPTMHEIQRHWIMSSPDAVLEMVRAIRQQHSDAIELHYQLLMLKEQNTMLDAKLAKADAALRQALEAFGEVAQWESEGDTAHPASKAIAAIKRVLKP